MDFFLAAFHHLRWKNTPRNSRILEFDHATDFHPFFWHFLSPLFSPFTSFLHLPRTAQSIHSPTSANGWLAARMDGRRYVRIILLLFSITDVSITTMNTIFLANIFNHGQNAWEKFNLSWLSKDARLRKLASIVDACLRIAIFGVHVILELSGKLTWRERMLNKFKHKEGRNKFFLINKSCSHGANIVGDRLHPLTVLEMKDA